MDQRALIMKHLFDSPLTPDEQNKLPSDVKNVLSQGKDAAELQLRVINDQLQGRSQSLSSSIHDLTAGYMAQIQDAESKKEAAEGNIQNYLQMYGSGAVPFLKAKYPDASSIIDKLAGVQTLAEREKNRVSSSGGGSGGASALDLYGDGGTYDSDLDALIGNTYNLISSKNGKDAFTSSIEGARGEADKINSIASVVLKNSPAEVKRDFVNQTVGIKEIDKAIALLDSGTKSGVINNGLQYAYNVVGKDFDPKLAAINAHITAAIQPYRNSVTGAAWGDQEDAEYASLFGSTKYSPKELKERLIRVKQIMADKSAAALKAQINPISEYDPFTKQSAPDLSSWMTDYNYDRDIADARKAIADGADKNAVKARLLQKYKQVDL